jgi:hypothetical protein
MTSNNIEQALARLGAYRTSGRLIRGKWGGVENGQEVACLLAALSPEAGEARDPSGCPAELLDPWFASITVWFDDTGSEDAWPMMVARYGPVVRKLMSLPTERRARLDYGARAIIVREAMRHTTDAQVFAACEAVAALCEGVAAGQPRDDVAFKTAARAAARAATDGWAIVDPAAWAAAHAEWSARAGAEAMGGAKTDQITTAIFDMIECAK